MSSGQHTPRRSPSLRDLSRHDLRAVLSHDQQRTADNRPVPYVGRIGRDRHLVRNPGSDTIYSVGGPAYSFKPGTMVLLGSNTGRPGESIIALPSPAQRGTSAYPESRFGGSLTFPAPEDPPTVDPCTVGLLGRQYLGVHATGGSFYAYSYTDNALIETLASVASSLLNPSFTQRGVDSTTGDEYVVGRDLESSTWWTFSWNITTNTLSIIEVSPQISRTVIGPVIIGSTMYYALIFSATTATIFSSPLGGTSPTTVANVTDSTISWSAFPYIAAMGADTILIQGYKSSDPFETRVAWSNVPAAQLRLSPFSFDDDWVPQGVAFKVGSQALIKARYGTSAIVRTAFVNSDGTHEVLNENPVSGASHSVFTDSSILSVNEAQAEMCLYESGNGALRIPIQDYNYLDGCGSVVENRTGVFDDMPTHGAAPGIVFARD